MMEIGYVPKESAPWQIYCVLNSKMRPTLMMAAVTGLVLATGCKEADGKPQAPQQPEVLDEARRAVRYRCAHAPLPR